MSLRTSRSGGWKRLHFRMVKMNCAPEGGMVNDGATHALASIQSDLLT